MSYKSWETNKYQAPLSQKLLTKLAFYIRRQQMKIFLAQLKPKKTDKVLDVGVLAQEDLPYTNYFEQHYPYQANLTVASIENCAILFKKKYPKINCKQIEAVKVGTPLPFPNQSFDIVCSWATLEHVGNDADQKYFIDELLRVGKKVFLTVPDRFSIFEPHTSFFFIHWLPESIFRYFCYLTGQKFWQQQENLNLVDQKQLISWTKKFKRVKIISQKLVGLWRSHLILVAN